MFMFIARYLLGNEHPVAAKKEKIDDAEMKKTTQTAMGPTEQPRFCTMTPEEIKSFFLCICYRMKAEIETATSDDDKSRPDTTMANDVIDKK